MIGTNEALLTELRPSGGARVRSREVAGFAFAEARYRAHGRTALHSHELAGFAVVMRGRFAKRIHRTTHDCGHGTITLEPPGVNHAEYYGVADVQALLVEILPWRREVIDDDIPLPSAPICARNGIAVALGRRALNELRAADAASPLVLEGIALELIGLAVRGGAASREAPRWLVQVTARLHDEFRANLTLNELAAGAGVHPAHLTRVFRVHHGCSIGEFVRRSRIQWAAEQLVTTAEPLAFLSLRAGFYDQSHFTRVFTQHMGVSPSRYRALGG